MESAAFFTSVHPVDQEDEISDCRGGTGGVVNATTAVDEQVLVGVGCRAQHTQDVFSSRNSFSTSPWAVRAHGDRWGVPRRSGEHALVEATHVVQHGHVTGGLMSSMPATSPMEKSRSTAQTRFTGASSAPRLTVTKVLPTPPLAPMTATTWPWSETVTVSEGASRTVRRRALRPRARRRSLEPGAHRGADTLGLCHRRVGDEDEVRILRLERGTDRQCGVGVGIEADDDHLRTVSANSLARLVRWTMSFGTAASPAKHSRICPAQCVNADEEDGWGCDGEGVLHGLLSGRGRRGRWDQWGRPLRVAR